MLKALYWRINLNIKKIKSKRLRKKLGKSVRAIITESKNGLFAVDPEDLEVGQKILSGGFAIDEIDRLKSYIGPESNILIVGAHIGSVAIPLSNHCKSVIAIEANPKTFELLLINIQLNNVKNISAHNILASDKYEKVEFLMNTVNSGGSKRKPQNSNFIYEYDNPKSIHLDSVPLDEHLQGEKFDFILIDIEGSEYFAMKGMEKILSQCNTLVVEFLPHHLKNVAGINVEEFISVIPTQFEKFNLPDKNQTHDFSKRLEVLQDLYNSNIGEDGIIFTMK